MASGDVGGVDPMECDAELLRYRAEQATVMEGRWFYDLTPEGARELHRKIGQWNRDGQEVKRPVKEIIDHGLQVGGSYVPMRVYKPDVTGSSPIVVYYHGGGWVFGDIGSYDEIARLICDACGVVVVMVEYPLAPEHKFPGPLLTCIECVSWTKQNASAMEGDPDAVLVMGDSAGGNLAAATAIACARRDIQLAGQVILYGPLVHMDYAESVGLRPWSDRDQRFGPTLAATSWYWDSYLESREQASDPRASVLLETELASVAPAVIAAGVLDTFAEECVSYGHKLADSGVKVQTLEYPRLTHGYLAHGWLSPSRRSTLAHEAAMETLDNVKLLAHS